MRPVTLTVGPLTAATANNIAPSQTPTGGTFVLNGSLASGGIATLSSPQRIKITTADTTHTFTITGTTPTGSVISETTPVGNGTSLTSALSYATVTSVVASGTPTAAATIGTSGVGDAWVRLDEWANPGVSIQVDITGTVNYTIQSSMDDPNSPTNPVLPASMTWINSPDATAVAATAAIQTSLGGFNAYAAMSPTFVRIVLNSGSGSVTATVVQSSVTPR